METEGADSRGIAKGGEAPSFARLANLSEAKFAKAKNGAGEEIRTLDLFLGKEAL